MPVDRRLPQGCRAGRYTGVIVSEGLFCPAAPRSPPGAPAAVLREHGVQPFHGPTALPPPAFFMSLRIYNTLTRRVEPFSPIEPGHVRMYVCGITVYDLCHVGHARSAVAFDLVQRWLRTRGLRVTFVRNITDIDDKIIRRATANGESIRGLTDRMVAEMYRDFDALGIERPTHDPRATDYVRQMLSMIATLERKGLAYRSGNGDVKIGRASCRERV